MNRHRHAPGVSWIEMTIACLGRISAVKKRGERERKKGRSEGRELKGTCGGPFALAPVLGSLLLCCVPAPRRSWLPEAYYTSGRGRRLAGLLAFYYFFILFTDPPSSPLTKSSFDIHRPHLQYINTLLRHSTAQHSTAQHSTTQHSTAQHGETGEIN